MRHIIYTYFLLSIVVISTSCSNKQYQALFERRNSINDSLAKNVAPVTTYRIKPLDILQIRNLQDTKYIANEAPTNANISQGNASQGQTYEVAEDGIVTLPAIGHVQVGGLTRVEAQKTIEDLYKKTLLKDPIIELKIINLKVTILGEIKQQGNYPLTKDRTTLVELIGEAGGLTEKANEKSIKIIRGDEKSPTVIQIDLSDLQSINSTSSVLQSGDIVYVNQNKRAVRGDNLQSFSAIAQPALILINTALIIFTLIRH